MEKTLGQRELPLFHRVLLLVLTALFAAFACVATMVLVVPSPTGGYMNLGDAVVLTGAFLLGPVYGAIAGGVGSALADLLAGYASYVPATLVIKAVMGLLAGVLYRGIGRKWNGLGLLVCAAAGEIPMIIGYWLYDGFWMKSLTGAVGHSQQPGAGGLWHRGVRGAGGGPAEEPRCPQAVSQSVISEQSEQGNREKRPRGF